MPFTALPWTQQPRQRPATAVAAVAAVVALSLASGASVALAGAPATLEAGTLSRSGPRAHLVVDRGTRSHRALSLSPGAAARGTLSTSHALASVAVRARASRCGVLTVSLDGGSPVRLRVTGAAYRSYTAALAVPAGAHRLVLGNPAHSRRLCRDAVRVADIELGPAAPIVPAGAPQSSDPLAALAFYVAPDSSAARQARSWRASRPADAAVMDKIAAQPQAVWFGDWSTTVGADVHNVVSQAHAGAALPVLVAYDLPNLDCGGYSSGGAPSPEAYRTWIRDFAAGIGSDPAAVILEPDALAELDCLSTSDRAGYISLLSDAIGVLSALPNVALYVDAGNSGWQSTATMAERLGEVGASRARGFALNVSNFQTTAAETAYGDDLAGRPGSPAHFVIDTSRNGSGPAGGDAWCNPDGRSLGAAPTAHTGDPALDAYLWIKSPGESDGTCNGGPAAGVWWPQYALGLAQRAGY